MLPVWTPRNGLARTVALELHACDMVASNRTDGQRSYVRFLLAMIALHDSRRQTGGALLRDLATSHQLVVPPPRELVGLEGVTCRN